MVRDPVVLRHCQGGGWIEGQEPNQKQPGAKKQLDRMAAFDKP